MKNARATAAMTSSNKSCQFVFFLFPILFCVKVYYSFINRIQYQVHELGICLGHRPLKRFARNKDSSLPFSGFKNPFVAVDDVDQVPVVGDFLHLQRKPVVLTEILWSHIESI